MLPYYAWQDFREVMEEMQEAGLDFDDGLVPCAVRVPLPAHGRGDGSRHGNRDPQRPGTLACLGEEPGGRGTVRYVDSSLERVQVQISGLSDPGRYMLTCNGRHVPLQPTGDAEDYVAGVRFRAWQPSSALHPSIGVHAPLTFDLIDTWNGRSIGGCRYHVATPAAVTMKPPRSTGRRPRDGVWRGSRRWATRRVRRVSHLSNATPTSRTRWTCAHR